MSYNFGAPTPNDKNTANTKRLLAVRYADTYPALGFQVTALSNMRLILLHVPAVQTTLTCISVQCRGAVGYYVG